MGVVVSEETNKRNGLANDSFPTEDGKLLDLDCENIGIKGLIEECDRHSRVLQKQADLADA